MTETTQDFLVGAGERQSVKLVDGEPATGAFARRLCDFSAAGIEGDAVAGDGVFDGAERFGRRDAEVACQTARISPLDAVITLVTGGAHGVTRPATFRFDFAVRKFPKVRVDHARRALADQEFAAALDHEGDETAGGGGFAFSEFGEFVLLVLLSRDAELLDRTGGTVR